MQAGVALHKYLINNQKKRIKKGNIEIKSSTSTSNSFCVPVNINEKVNDLSNKLEMKNFIKEIKFSTEPNPKELLK